jgi:hypothetical protein
VVQALLVLLLLAGLSVGGQQLYISHLNSGIKERDAQLTLDAANFKEIQKSADKMKADSQRVLDALAKAAKLNGARQKQESTRVATIEAIQPKGETECERTDDAITRALR